MSLRTWLSKLWRPAPPSDAPANLRRGQTGENAARQHLQDRGLKFLTANYRGPHGEIDLVFRDHDCLVFVEVKARAADAWTRPAAAVNARKRRAVAKTAFAYLRQLDQPHVKIRFDVVEVLLEDDRVVEVRHLPTAFHIPSPASFG
ncbi:MAG: YraN family protein [Verrucomicrobiales bacterium]|nr:YraN family protein [Verrucomicrobiales bacterium]